MFPVFRDPVALEALVNMFMARILTAFPKVDVIVGLDARGFLLGPILAMRLKAAFVPIRKKGKVRTAGRRFVLPAPPVTPRASTAPRRCGDH